MLFVFISSALSGSIIKFQQTPASINIREFSLLMYIIYRSLFLPLKNSLNPLEHYYNSTLGNKPFAKDFVIGINF